jgi:PAS domain S-box-containing protein
MPIPLNPSNETERLGAVAAYGILDKGGEMELDSVAEIAAQLCGAPIAWVSLVDETHERIKGHFGFVPEGIPRGISLCALALDGSDVVVVPNAAQDERFADHPLVVGEPCIKFYAAAPLRNPQGEVVGALAVMDHKVRELSEGQRSGLKRLSRQVMTYLEQRREIGALKLEQAQLRQRKTRLRQSDRRLVDIVTRMTEACFALDRQWRFTFVNDRCETLLRRRRGEILGRTIWDVFGKLVGTPIEQQYRRAMAERVPVSFESYSPIAERWLDVRLIPTEEGLGAFLLDIHERKILEVERQKFVSLAENSREFIGMSDLEGIPFYINEAARRMMGAETRAEAQFKPVSEYFFPEDQPYILNEFLPRALAEGHAETEVRFRHFKTGAAVWMIYHVFTIRDASGVVIGFATVSRDISERKRVEEALRAREEHAQALLQLSQQAEQALRVSEERIQTVIKHMTDGLVMAKLDGQLVHWNPAALEMHGFTSDEEWCRGVAEFESIFEVRTLDGQLVPFNEWPMPRLMRGEILRGVDLRLRRIGTDWERVFRYSGAIAREPNGERLIFLTMADITAHRLAEESLESSRRFLSEVIENSGSLIFVKDREGRYQLVNQKWEEVTGRSRTEVLGATDAEIFSEDDARRFRETDAAIMESGRSQTIEEMLSEKNRTRSFLSVKFPLKDAAGHVSGVCGMTAEITERKEAEEKLREQATLLDKAQDAILVRTLEHEVKYWNKSAERLYGWTAEEAVGRSVQGLIYNDTTAFLVANETTLTKGEWIGEIEQFTKDGRALVVEGRWTLVRDEQGNPKSVLAINTDLTERKKLEEQFLRAQRMESIGTLAGGIAHDLNNVLGPILMSLELLKMRFPDRESQQLISIISASGERGAAMVKQVLSFARGVAGERLEVQVRHLVNDIARIINETFLKHVEIRTIIPHDLWTVIGDATQLHQVLLNLCVNARDAMPNGGVLTISAENVMLDAQYAGLNAEAAAGPYVSLQVEDSGTGIPSEIMEKIFDPFFTTKETGKGTGLGLATTLAIVKSHGGFIRVYSEVGRGTRFKTYLPATESPGNSEAVRAAELPRGNGECILIVDDEASVRQITQQTLEAFGYRVIVACDGAEALSIYAPRQAEIAAVVTDMMMPIMDGPALIQVLQRMNPKMPILAASGLVAEGQVARAARLGIKHFLPKPYTAETLLKNLKQALADGAD